METHQIREAQLRRRHFRVRKKISGTAERPRLVIHRSHLHLSAQLIDDMAGKTLACASTQDPTFRKQMKAGGNIQAAQVLGKLVSQTAQKSGIKKVVFDRGGYRYHGRIKALADAVRETGLEM